MGLHMERILLQARELVGESYYLNLLQISIRLVLLALFFLIAFLALLSLLVLRKDLSTGDVAVLRPQNLILYEFRRSVMFGTVEVRQILHELIHVVPTACIHSPFVERSRHKGAGRPQDVQLRIIMSTMELSSMSFLRCCTLTCLSYRPGSPSSRSTVISGRRSPAARRLGRGFVLR
jgi:hypothetical protein